MRHKPKTDLELIGEIMRLGPGAEAFVMTALTRYVRFNFNRKDKEKTPRWNRLAAAIDAILVTHGHQSPL